MPITRTPMVDDDGSGTTGTIINAAWKTELYNQIDALAAAAGVWTDIAFNAANFTSAIPVGTWTVSAGNVSTLAYMLQGKTLWLAVVLSSTVVGGAPSRLRFQLPAGLTVARQQAMPFNLYDGQSGSAVGYAITSPGGNYIDFMRDLVGTAWGNGATHVHAGNLIVNVN